jgi:hypothetical protein
MPRLSKTSATRIASLFNSIMVGETFQRRFIGEMKYDDASNWDRHAARAARDLKAEFGIEAVGMQAAIDRLERFEAERRAEFAASRSLRLADPIDTHRHAA